MSILDDSLIALDMTGKKDHDPLHFHRADDRGMYLIYNILLLISAIFLIPYYLLKMLLTGKYRRSFWQKLGFTKSEAFKNMTGYPRIWIHAVSVGEVTAAAPIIAALKEQMPASCILLSTSTETGREMAEKIITATTAMIYFPLDIPFVVRRMLNNVRPNVFVMIETELWPNFLRSCKDFGVKTLLINGRISPRSFKRYHATRFFWKRVLNLVDEAAVISETDAQRLSAIGKPYGSISVFGNAKYDSLASKASPDVKDRMELRLNLKADEKIFVAGSTHESEEEVVASVYRKVLEHHTDLKLILVPRHIERTPEVLNVLRNAGFNDIITLSEIDGGRKRQHERIIVVDRIGELFKIYSLATLVFCGGSLVPRGGQNILEAAAWGKIVFFGPHMEDFEGEKLLLEWCGAGITVHSGDELAARILESIGKDEKLKSIGEKGRQAVLSNTGASQRYADLVRTKLP